MRLLVLSMATLRRTPRRVRCTAVQHLLYSSESGGRALPGSLSRHRGSCLACQADTARHRQIMRGMAELRTETEAMPYDLATALEAGIVVPSDEGAESQRSPRTTRNALAGAAGAASLAAIGVVVAWRAKRAS